MCHFPLVMKQSETVSHSVHWVTFSHLFCPQI